MQFSVNIVMPFHFSSAVKFFYVKRVQKKLQNEFEKVEKRDTFPF